MFTVRITFLDEIDEFGYVFKEYEFEDVYEARAFYDLKKSDYKDDGLVSVTCDCYWTWRRDFQPSSQF